MTLENLDELTIDSSVNLAEYEHRYDINTIIVDALSPVTLTLPAYSASVDKELTVVKACAATVTLQVVATGHIATSATGSYLYNGEAGEVNAAIKLRLLSNDNWTVLGFQGTWKIEGGTDI